MLSRKDCFVVTAIAIVVNLVVSWGIPVVVASVPASSAPPISNQATKMAGHKHVLEASRIQIDSTTIIYTGTDVTDVHFVLTDTGTDDFTATYNIKVSLAGTVVSEGDYDISCSKIGKYKITVTTDGEATNAPTLSDERDIKSATFECNAHLGEFTNTPISGATPIEILITETS